MIDLRSDRNFEQPTQVSNGERLVVHLRRIRFKQIEVGAAHGMLQRTDGLGRPYVFFATQAEGKVTADIEACR